MNTFMRAGRVIASIAVVAAVIACCNRQSGDISKKENEAAATAALWLLLIDEQQYSRSWDESAAFFKRSVPREKWTGLMIRARMPFGKVLNRTLKERKYSRALPGAPDGEYVVITYKTSFQNKKQSIETVTPMKEADGKWRVSGYYIK